MFKLKQITGDWPLVMVRCTMPGSDKVEYKDTMLMGYCSYINGEVKSLDGDTYSLEDDFTKAEVIETDTGEQMLVLTYKASWK